MEMSQEEPGGADSGKCGFKTINCLIIQAYSLLCDRHRKERIIHEPGDSQ